MSYTYGSNIAFESDDATYDGSGQFNTRQTPTAEFIRRINLPNIQKVFLLTVTTGFEITGPEITTGNLFRARKPDGAQVIEVHRNGGKASLEKIDEIDFLDQGKFFDNTDGYVYIGAPYGRTPYQDLYTATLQYRFATMPKKFRGVFWQPRLDKTPNLSLRIEALWSTLGSPAQIGGGKAVLNNADGYFDDKDSDNIQWDAGFVTLEMGIDLAGVGTSGEMSEADYLRIGTWTVESTDRSDTAFTLNLREIKRKLANQIPHLLFDRETYPNISQENIGKPIPFAWGKIYGAKPVLIDPGAKRFKVASHPIHSFDGVRVQIDEVWTNVNFATTDLQLAEFTLGSEWTGNESVSVDFNGRKKPDGSLMTNCSDVMADLLDYVGETNFDDTSFIESHRLLKVGTNRYGHEVNSLAPSIYVDSQKRAEEVAAKINEVAGSSLFVDFDGNWRYVVFQPTQSANLANSSAAFPRTFTEKQIIGEIRKQVDNTRVASKVLVKFAHRRQENWFETYEHNLERNRLLHNLPHQFLAGEEESGVEPALSEFGDAKYWAGRYLATEGQPLVRYYFAVPWTGFFILPTDKIRVQYARNGFDSVLEVLEVNYDLVAGKLSLVCGNQRGFGDSFGFWQADAVSNYSAAWTDAQVTEARQNQGFWVGVYSGTETDMADYSDYRSVRIGRWF
jgi:hypothetical protein